MTTVTEAAAEHSKALAAPTPKEVLRDLISRNIEAVGLSLPLGYDAQRFGRLLLTAANTNPELFECDPRSFLAAGVACAQLGLEPNDARGLAYLVPFRDKRRGHVVTMIVGYRGMLDLARRSGLVTAINAFEVYADDHFSYRLGLDPNIEHVPAEGDEDPATLTHVYAVARIGADTQFVVLTRRQVDKVKATYARSAASPWHTHFVEMAKKTALRRLCKYLPQTVELAQAGDVEERGLVLSGDLAMPPAIEAVPGMTDDDRDDAIESEDHDDGGDDPGDPDPPPESPDDGTAVPPKGGRRRGATPSTSAAPPPATDPATDDQPTLPDA